MRRVFFGVFCLLAAGSALAQQVHSASGRGTPRITSTPRAAHNSMAKGTEPLNCEQYRNHPHPAIHSMCQGMEARLIQSEAVRAGRPAASTEVVTLPGLGTSGAKSLGFACVGGQAFRKLPNGWAQVSSPHGGWQRCREG